MQIPVLIESIAGNGHRARGGEPLRLTVDGPTREAALHNLREKLQARLANGAELVTLELTPASHPLAELVCMLRDDPLREPWKAAMADYRQTVDQEPDMP